MSHRHRLTGKLLPALGLLALQQAHAQTIEYDVTDLGEVPGAYITYAHGMNDHGQLVGTALFIPGGQKAWTWTASHGYQILPQPPSISGYAAVDINNAGVIAGDGGGDSGQIWRYTGGTYEMLGFLPGTPIPRAAAISETGSITGTCLGTTFYNPHHTFIAVPGAAMESVLDDSYGYHINDSDQVTGRAPGNVAYRSTPGVGIELLPPLGDRFLTGGYSLNNAGNVVGVAASTLEHSDVPFHFSDAGGMQEVGDFGGRAFAADVNDLDEVIGEHEPSSGTRRAWVWSANEGVRYLNDVIDPGLGVWLKYARAINNAGQILCESQQGGLHPILLTPREDGPTAYCDPPNGNSVSAGGALLSHVSGQPGGTMTFQIDATPAQPGVLFFGTDQLDLPFGCGRRCVGGSVVRSVVYFPSGNSIQAVLDTNGTATVPFNIQYWYRDPANSGACGDSFNLTNALGF